MTGSPKKRQSCTGAQSSFLTYGAPLPWVYSPYQHHPSSLSCLPGHTATSDIFFHPLLLRPSFKVDLRLWRYRHQVNRACPFLENRSGGMTCVSAVSSVATSYKSKMGWGNVIPRAQGSEWTMSAVVSVVQDWHQY